MRPAPKMCIPAQHSIKNTPDEPAILEIEFKEGLPVAVHNKDDGNKVTGALKIFEYLNDLGTEHGIGRLDMVENRFVGIKSRGVYETPGGDILYKAHRDLEGLVMDREVMKIRDKLSIDVAHMIYNGFWFAPEFDLLMHTMDKAQEVVNGVVTIQLFKGMAYPLARTSPNALYDPLQSSMDEEGGYDQKDADGFIKINAVRLMNNTKVHGGQCKDKNKKAA